MGHDPVRKPEELKKINAIFDVTAKGPSKSVF